MEMTAREKIIATGVEMVGLNGYTATGVDSVLKAAGVPKGSFYHHFGTKENFGIEVINLFAENYTDKLYSFLGDDAYPPLERIFNYMEHSIAHLTQNNFSKGCLIGNLGQELADQNERFRDRLAEIFNSWIDMFTVCLSQAQRTGTLNSTLDPKTVAGFLLSGWEGAILRAKVVRSS